MPSNQDGEFELILGNKQLLSVFFIVVVLLGVFFAMGYVVGRNSAPMKADAPMPAATKTAAGAETAKPLMDANPSPMPVQQAPQQAAQEPPQQTPPAPAPVEKKPVETAKPAPVEEKPAPAADAPPKGVYWQVAATRRAEADMLVDLLKSKGYAARTIPAPGPEGFFRVIVGPAPNTAALSALKGSLEAAGYKQPIKREY